MKKRLLGVALVLCMVLALMPTALAVEEPTAMAVAETEEDGIMTLDVGDTLPAPVEGVITLENDVTLSATHSVTADEIIDLNGFTLTGKISVNPYASLIIRDGSEAQTGKLTLSSGHTCVVWYYATLTVESGHIENTAASGYSAIYNMGTVNIEGGKLTGNSVVYNTAVNGTPVPGNIVCNISGGEIIPTSWGVTAIGPGVTNGDISTVNNDKVVINISGGKITGTGDVQGIATNASNGQKAGFTINITDGEIDMGTGTGMYLPAIGVTKISGGKISAAQAIRICAGTLNITGGVVEGTAVSDGSDLMPGGSGGTLGAIVVGKAGEGYVGDINVNVSGNAVIQNTAEGDGVKPTIVVSDKNMALAKDQQVKNPDGTASEATFNYSNTSISVVVDGAQVSGDVVQISNLTANTTTQDGGNTKVEITNGATVTGNVTNQSKTETTINNANVGGNVTNTNADGGAKVTVVESTIGTAGDNVTVVDSTVNGSTNVSTVDAVIGTTHYATLAEAIAAANDGETIKLMRDIEVSLDNVAKNEAAITINKNITLDGNGHTIKATRTTHNDSSKQHVLLVSGANVEATIKNLTVDGNNEAKHGIQAYGGAKVTLNTVTSNNNQGYGVLANQSAITATDLKTSGNGWSGVNVDSNGTEQNPNQTASFTLDGENSEVQGIVIESSAGDTTTTTIKAGTVQGILVHAGEGESAGTDTIVVTGGTVNQITGAIAETDKVTLSGGKFLTDITKYLADSTPATSFKEKDAEQANYYVGADAMTPLVNVTNWVSGDTLTVLQGELRLDTTHMPNGVIIKSTDKATVLVGTGNDASQEFVEVTPDKEYVVHTHNYAQKHDTEEHWKECGTCGHKAEVGTHTWDEGKVTTEPTYTAKGEKTYTCTVCGRTKTEELPMLSEVPATKVTLSADKTTAKVGDTVTLTVTTEPANTTDTAVITCEPVGIAEVKNDKTVTIKAPGVVTITATAGDQTASVKITVDCDYGDGCASKDYKDVPNEYTWYHSAVDYVLSNEIMQGRPGKIFDAGATINRAEMAQILYNMAGQPEYTVTKTFPDVPEDTWYYDPVMWAASVGVIEGFQDGTFQPAAPLNRQSMVVMIWRYYGKPEPKDADAALAQFPDAKVGVWNKDSFAWMVENEYVNGKDGKLAAGQNSNRAEVAQILMKMGAKVEE